MFRVTMSFSLSSCCLEEAQEDCCRRSVAVVMVFLEFGTNVYVHMGDYGSVIDDIVVHMPSLANKKEPNKSTNSMGDDISGLRNTYKNFHNSSNSRST